MLRFTRMYVSARSMGTRRLDDSQTVCAAGADQPEGKVFATTNAQHALGVVRVRAAVAVLVHSDHLGDMLQ